MVELRDHRAEGYGLDVESLPVTQSAARDAGARYYFTGRACRAGHVAARYTSSGVCSVCTMQRAAERRGSTFAGAGRRALANLARARAAKSDAKTYVPAVPCRHGHSLRWTSSNNCVECDRLARGRRAEKHRDRRILKTYGLTRGDVEQMHADQGGACKICATAVEVAAAHIDHCHTSGRVRGLLCGPCNQGLGLFKENPAFLRAAAEYLGNG